MFQRPDWNSDHHVIKTELDYANDTLDNFSIPARNIAQENFISCGDGSEDESFLPETRTCRSSSSGDESDNFQQDYNESENLVSECPRFVKVQNQEVNNSEHNALQSSLCDTKFATLKSNVHPGSNSYEGKICSTQYSAATSLKLHSECFASVSARVKFEKNAFNSETNLSDTHKDVNGEKSANQCKDKEHLVNGNKPCTPSITSLKNHAIRTHSRNEKKDRQICSVCGKAFSSTGILNIHMREKHLPDTDPRRYFKCSRCDSKFDTEYHLRVHNLTHKNIGTFSFTYICDYCQREYNNRKNFVNHMYAMHSNLRTIYSCSYCPKGFRSRDHRDDHENTHTGKRPNQCMLCFKDFASSSALRRHIKGHKNDASKTSKNETINCDTAEDSTEKFHKKTHKRTKAQLLTRTDSSSTLADSKGKYPCAFCTAVYRHKEKRDSHLNKHTGQKPHQCMICSKKFMSEAYLSKHKKLIHLSETEKATAVKYECSFCSKIYHRRKVFDKHLKSHSGVSPFQCELCSKGYMNQWRLNRHIKKGCTTSK